MNRAIHTISIMVYRKVNLSDWSFEPFLRFKSFHFQLKREYILSDIPGSPESQRLFGAKEEQRRCGRLFFNEKVGASKACSDVVGMTGYSRFASCLLDDRFALLAVPVCAPTSLKTIINRFLYARCLLEVQILPVLCIKKRNLTL